MKPWVLVTRVVAHVPPTTHRGEHGVVNLCMRDSTLKTSSARQPCIQRLETSTRMEVAAKISSAESSSAASAAPLCARFKIHILAIPAGFNTSRPDTKRVRSGSKKTGVVSPSHILLDINSPYFPVPLFAPPHRQHDTVTERGNNKMSRSVAAARSGSGAASAVTDDKNGESQLHALTYTPEPSPSHC